jgi:hypothetical protein
VFLFSYYWILQLLLLLPLSHHQQVDPFQSLGLWWWLSPLTSPLSLALYLWNEGGEEEARAGQGGRQGLPGGANHEAPSDRYYWTAGPGM